ncbi:MAG: MFS transporter [Nitrososphaerota archaeon]
MGRARQLSILSLSHLVNDMYGSVLPPLYPLLATIYGLTYAAAGLYTAAYLFASAFLQPLFGYIFDRYQLRFMLPLSLVLGAVGIGVLGVMDSFEASLVCVAVAGMGSAIYHPIASAYSSYESERRGLLFSIFMIAGRVGAAVAPFLSLWAAQSFGLRGLAIFALPTVLLLYFTFRLGEYEGARTNGAMSEGRGAIEPCLSRRDVFILTSLVALSGLGLQIAANGVVSFLSFLAVWRGFGSEFGGFLLTLLFVGAIAGVPLTSYLSDLKGRYTISVILLALASAVIFPLPFVDPVGMAGAVISIGACTVSLHTLLILIMHEIMPGLKGLATSVIYGVALGGGGLLAPLVGYVIDVGGFQYGFTFLSIMGFASLIPLTIAKRMQQR